MRQFRVFAYEHILARVDEAAVLVGKDLFGRGRRLARERARPAVV
jgi:hypothetical protein